MIKREVKNCQPYEAPKHFNMSALRLHGKDESGITKFWVGMSHFLPKGGAEYDESPVEKVYFVLSGEVTVYSKDEKEKFVLGPTDSIHIGSGEGRTLVNESNLPATMLVIVNYPNS
ncbi:cupin domain-containing protein [Holophaga foetida]|uniref:cupin domain-containing protein n=1 Tax=Holophaga foetida TaxID=35839 RepID=UPI00024746B1|nr:cupin domain-containing protein [Holophaga foetida]